MYDYNIKALKLCGIAVVFIILLALILIINFVTERPSTEAMAEKNYGNSMETAAPTDKQNTSAEPSPAPTEKINLLWKPALNWKPTETATPDRSEAPFATETPSQTASPDLVSPSPEPSIEPSIEPSVEPSPTPSPTPTPSPKPTPKPSPTVLPSPEPSPQPTENQTVKPTQPAGDALYGTNGYIWPTLSTRITSHYGMRDGKMHNGVDIGAVERGVAGDPIFAVEEGKVIRSFLAYSGSGYGGYGEVVVIQHDDGNYTLYAHCVERYVKVGDRVKKGDVIAGMGTTGQSTGVHLHFEIRQGSEFGDRINPEALFPDM